MSRATATIRGVSDDSAHGPALALNRGVDKTPLPSIGPFSTDTIVLDDAPMFLEDGSLLVEDDSVVSSIAELPPVADDSVIEVGDEVLFDS